MDQTSRASRGTDFRRRVAQRDANNTRTTGSLRSPGVCSQAAQQATGAQASTAQRTTRPVAAERFRMAHHPRGTAGRICRFEGERPAKSIGRSRSTATATVGMLRRVAGLALRPRLRLFFRLTGKLATWNAGNRSRHRPAGQGSQRKRQQHSQHPHQRGKQAAAGREVRPSAGGGGCSSCGHAAEVGEGGRVPGY